MRPDQDQGFKTTIISLTHPERRGIVFGQNPGAGQDVNKRSTVRLLVSKGLTTVAVPNAVGLADATARDRLVTAGFKVTEVKVFAPDAPGQVVAQDPAAGAKASKAPRYGSTSRRARASSSCRTSSGLPSATPKRGLPKPGSRV
jgi:hypothetical protein